ncbi:MAG: hypothetical protein F6K40_03930 [Okeania sp. SIO3I5]|nr:hypothetical protein [Okeania sp. SIO3I5]NEQ35493.1 hypothetical protein [Okeania sp. SIO3I5]
MKPLWEDGEDGEDGEEEFCLQSSLRMCLIQYIFLPKKPNPDLLITCQ